MGRPGSPAPAAGTTPAFLFGLVFLAGPGRRRRTEELPGDLVRFGQAAVLDQAVNPEGGGEEGLPSQGGAWPAGSDGFGDAGDKRQDMDDIRPHLPGKNSLSSRTFESPLQNRPEVPVFSVEEQRAIFRPGRI